MIRITEESYDDRGQPPEYRAPCNGVVWDGLATWRGLAES